MHAWLSFAPFRCMLRIFDLVSASPRPVPMHARLSFASPHPKACLESFASPIPMHAWLGFASPRPGACLGYLIWCGLASPRPSQCVLGSATTSPVPMHAYNYFGSTKYIVAANVSNCYFLAALFFESSLSPMKPCFYPIYCPR